MSVLLVKEFKILMTEEELKQKHDIMREGGKIMAQIFEDLRGFTKAGVTGLEADKFCESKILEYGAEVAYYEPEVDFPGSICISVNNELIHGIPKDIEFEDGDKVSYDLVIKYKGWYVDAAFTMVVGGDKSTSAIQRHLIKTTEDALMAGISKVKAGAHIGDLGAAVQHVLEKGKLGVIYEYVGHGIGTSMHMEPEIPNYGKKGRGPILKAGDTICIEPMSSVGKPETVVVEGDDGWTVCLKDGSFGAHCEHTIWVGEDGCEILTRK